MNCLILEDRKWLKFVPSQFPIYYINSKRRFFIYFRNRSQMMDFCTHVLNAGNARYYFRESLLPDREEYEEHVFHCNYKFRKVDFRKFLSPRATYNEPRSLFDHYDCGKLKPAFQPAK